MSKNFELMQEMLNEMQQETSPVPESARFVSPVSELDSHKRHGSLDFDGVAQEECLKLVQRIFLGKTENPCRAVTFVGIDRASGCSQICGQTARILAANTSASVCVVEANFRTPSLPRFFGVSNHEGLADSLLGEGAIRGFAKQLKPSNLWLLSGGAVTAGSPNLLNSDRLDVRMEDLRKEFDYILIDSPALNLYADAIAVGRVADGVVMVLQADSTRRESALKGLKSLREARIEVLGAVLNRRTFPIPDFVYRRL
jgi:Mrp family chromosome partitioning ATPase